jgi:hypothetical protein
VPLPLLLVMTAHHLSLDSTIKFEIEPTVNPAVREKSNYPALFPHRTRCALIRTHFRIHRKVYERHKLIIFSLPLAELSRVATLAAFSAAGRVVGVFVLTSCNNIFLAYFRNMSMMIMKMMTNDLLKY